MSCSAESDRELWVVIFVNKTGLPTKNDANNSVLLIAHTGSTTLKKSDFSKGEGRVYDPDFFFDFLFVGGLCLFPCDTDVGARQNGTCCCGRSRENVAQSSLASSVGKPVSLP